MVLCKLTCVAASDRPTALLLRWCYSGSEKRDKRLQYTTLLCRLYYGPRCS